LADSGVEEEAKLLLSETPPSTERKDVEVLDFVAGGLIAYRASSL
jgi:hypothetical protein